MEKNQKIEQKRKIIRYNYIESLVDNDYFKDKKYDDIMNNKIKDFLKKNKIEEDKNKNLKNRENEINTKIIDNLKLEIKGEKKNKREEEIEIKEKNEIMDEEEENELKDENKKEDKDKINKEFEKWKNQIHYILMKFNYIPKYFFEFINNYESIYDFLFYEYSKIYQKLNLFNDLNIINTDKIHDLIEGNYITEKDSPIHIYLDKIKFSQNLSFIPLKYINFSMKNINEFYFYYSFPLFKSIFKYFNNYLNSRIKFNNSENGGEIGINFEAIIKFEFRVFKHLGIDGYFKVYELLEMNLTKKYNLIDKNYFKNKNAIFIDQKKIIGKIYDFAIYKAKDKQLILIQCKYIINNDSVTVGKSYYKKSAIRALNAFNNITKEDVKNVYLLFISSMEYNNNNRNRAVNILENKRINCLFFSVNDRYFTDNFLNKTYEIIGTDSNMIIPDSTKYTKQRAFNEFKEKDKSYLGAKKKRDLDLEQLHNDIINYISNSNFENKNICSRLGIFKTVNTFIFTKKIGIKPGHYALLFYTDEFGNFAQKKNLILIYKEKLKKLNIYNFEKKIFYNNLDDILPDFGICFMSAVGELLEPNKEN